MRLKGFLIYFSLILVSTPSIYSAPKTLSRQELPNLQEQIETLQKDFDSKLNLRDKLLQKDLENIDDRFLSQGERIEDIKSEFDFFLTILAILLSIMGIILIPAGIIGYFSFGQKAQREAKEEAKRWFEENSLNIKQQIENLNREIKGTRDHADEARKQITAHEESVMEAAREATKNFQATIDPPDQEKRPTKEEEQDLEAAVELIKTKLETDYTYEDWKIRAHASIAKKDYESASYFWNNALAISDISEKERIRAMTNRGYVMGKLERHSEVIKISNEINGLYKDKNDPDMDIDICISLGNKGIALKRIRKTEEAIRSFDQLIQQFKDDQRLSIRIQVAKSFLNKAATLGEADNIQKAIETIEELIHQFEDDSNPALRSIVAKAIFNKAVAYGKIEKYEQSIQLYNQLINQYENDHSIEIQHTVAKSELYKAIDFSKINRTSEAIQIYDHLIEQFENDSRSEMQILVAKSFLGKAAIYAQINKTEEEFHTFNKLLELFKDNEITEVKDIVAFALNSKGFFLLIEGKKYWNDQQKRNALLIKAIENLNQALQKSQNSETKPDFFMILRNIAYTSHLLGKSEEEVRSRLVEALQGGGEKLYKETLKDINKNRIEVVDDGFERILNQVWKEVQDSGGTTELTQEIPTTE